MSKNLKKKSVSIRIPQDYYERLKKRANENRRTLIAELTIILDHYFKANPVKISSKS